MAKTVTVCVGSSCHVRGARELLRRFENLLKEHGLVDDVKLSGAFCMERCRDGLNWEVDGEWIASASVDEAEAAFVSRVIEAGKDG